MQITTMLPEGVKRPLRELRDSLKLLSVRIHPAPIFVLGHQKSGTTVIAAMLGEVSGLPVVLDLKREVQHGAAYQEVLEGRLSFKQYVAQNRNDFSYPIIKDPNLTFLYPQLSTRFPNSRYVFVVRNVRDCIRSILDRHRLPGDLPDLTPEQQIGLPSSWTKIFTMYGTDGMNYVERLASRWNAMAQMYWRYDDEMLLVRYEDFCADKVGVIHQLAERLLLPHGFDIRDKVDDQYQPKGANRNADLDRFFGANGPRIDRLCAAYVEKFGYETSDATGEDERCGLVARAH